ncbi:MAG TPA: hypothetical protein VI248_27005 [Kineosporiaceae bacterium]|nr:hypothetical protein [Anaeromyxobacteraceae bacterium]
MTLIELVVAAGSAELLALVVALAAMVHRPRVRLRLGHEARQPEVEREGARVVPRPAA